MGSIDIFDPVEVGGFDRHGYVLSGNGLHVIDLANPQSPPSCLCVLKGPGHAVSGHHVYLSGRRVMVIDVADPSAPVLLGEVDSPSEIAEWGGLTVSGSVVYASSNWGCDAIDVTDPVHPRVMGSLPRGIGNDVSGEYAHLVDEVALEIFPAQCDPAVAGESCQRSGRVMPAGRHADPCPASSGGQTGGSRGNDDGLDAQAPHPVGEARAVAGVAIPEQEAGHFVPEGCDAVSETGIAPRMTVTRRPGDAGSPMSIGGSRRLATGR